jgi:periplasmic copper chaperone A
MRLRTGAAGLIATALLPTASLAAGTEVLEAWTPAGGKSGGEAPLYMTVVNNGSAADTLARVRCPVAWASEQRITDRGEGAPSSRSVKSVSIPANATVKFEHGGYYVALLQLKEPLREGDSFSCSMTFGSGGPRDVTVKVAGAQQTPEAEK